jgi:hypothetical protein
MELSSFTLQLFTYNIQILILIATCLYGDQKGEVFSNGWTCQVMIANEPNNCAIASTSFCSSCGPTTPAPVTPAPNPTGSTPAQTTIVAQLEKDCE